MPDPRTGCYTEAEMRASFDRDCLREYGRILTGDRWHWCLDWDMLPIDDTCPEFDNCNCNIPPKRKSH